MVGLRDHVIAGLVGVLVAGIGGVIGAAVLDTYIADQAIRDWGIAALVPGSLLGGAIVYHALLTRRPPPVPAPATSAATDARVTVLDQVIEEGRELQTHLPDDTDPGYANRDNEAFTQWQGGVMRWDERVRRRLQEIAPERIAGYQLPVYLNRSEPYPELPGPVRNLMIELDTRVERLALIRETLSPAAPQSPESSKHG